MLAAVQSVPGLWAAAKQQADGTTKPAGIVVSGIGWSLVYYGKKYAPTGATTADAFGNQVPVKTPVTGVYAVLRWTRTKDPPTPPAGGGVTIIPMPADSPYVFL